MKRRFVKLLIVWIVTLMTVSASAADMPYGALPSSSSIVYYQNASETIVKLDVTVGPNGNACIYLSNPMGMMFTTYGLSNSSIRYSGNDMVFSSASSYFKGPDLYVAKNWSKITYQGVEYGKRKSESEYNTYRDRINALPEAQQVKGEIARSIGEEATRIHREHRQAITSGSGSTGKSTVKRTKTVCKDCGGKKYRKESYDYYPQSHYAPYHNLLGNKCPICGGNVTIITPAASPAMEGIRPGTRADEKIGVDAWQMKRNNVN